MQCSLLGKDCRRDDICLVECNGGETFFVECRGGDKPLVECREADTSLVECRGGDKPLVEYTGGDASLVECAGGDTPGGQILMKSMDSAKVEILNQSMVESVSW